MGLKDGGLRSGGLRNISTVDRVPNSVTWQIVGESFSTADSTWQDEIQSNDVGVVGDPQTEAVNNGQIVNSDGVDDEGTAPVPTTEDSAEFGLALTFKTTDDSFIGFGHFDGTQGFELDLGRIDADSGQLGLYLQDSSGNNASAHADTTINDGNIHYMIINKNTDNPNDWDFYVDQTDSTTSKTVTSNGGYDTSNYSRSIDLGIWGRNNSGTYDEFGAIGFGVIELKSSSYSESERDGFVSRRDEIQ